MAMIDAGETNNGVVVIIVNWNSGDWLARTLAALKHQTWRKFGVIVVDNASSDNSIEDALVQWSDIQVIRLPENLGFAAANNLAVENAKGGRWLAFLNPDAVPAEDWLEKLLDAAQANESYSFFGSRQLSAESDQILDGIGDTYHVSGLVWRTGHGASAQGMGEEAREIFSPCAAAALYDRQAFLAVGGFDPAFFCYLEDVDLGFRMRLAGYRALHVPTAVVRHAGSAITGRRSNFTVYHGQRNLVWVYWKNMPTALFWKYLLPHLAINFWAIIHHSLRGRAAAVLRAKWDALHGLPAMMSQRRAVQSGRTVSLADIRRCMASGWPDRSVLPRSVTLTRHK